MSPPSEAKLTWNLSRLLMAKNRVKLLLNMLLIAGQAIPRGGTITVDPVGEGENIGFQITATGPNAKVQPAVSALFAGDTGGEAVDAHRIQPFYAGLLARDCGVQVGVEMQGEAVVVSAK